MPSVLYSNVRMSLHKYYRGEKYVWNVDATKKIHNGYFRSLLRKFYGSVALLYCKLFFRFIPVLKQYEEEGKRFVVFTMDSISHIVEGSEIF